MPGIFLGLKFQACVFFWVCNMKLRRTPPSCILRVPPGHASSANCKGYPLALLLSALPFGHPLGTPVQIPSDKGIPGRDAQDKVNYYKYYKCFNF